MRQGGHYVVGVDSIEVPGVRERTDEFYTGNLDSGLPADAGVEFDVVIAGDVIEHLAKPIDALRAIDAVLRPGGQLLLSVPNFAHWYPRLRVAFGVFGYDRRGILDDTHLRFFTRSTLRRLVRTAGFDVLEESATGLPLGTVSGGAQRGSAIRRIDQLLVRLRPTLFGYQHVLRLTPHAAQTIHSDHLEFRAREGSVSYGSSP
jgi:SAM-dependent methyltransferase